MTGQKMHLVIDDFFRTSLLQQQCNQRAAEGLSLLIAAVTVLKARSAISIAATCVSLVCVALVLHRD